MISKTNRLLLHKIFQILPLNILNCYFENIIVGSNWTEWSETDKSLVYIGSLLVSKNAQLHFKKCKNIITSKRDKKYIIPLLICCISVNKKIKNQTRYLLLSFLEQFTGFSVSLRLLSSARVSKWNELAVS